MKLTYRIHEWLAAKVSWVQYPKPQQVFIPLKPEIPFRLVWATPMSLWQRLYIFFMSLLLLIVASVIAVFVAGIFYLVFRASVAP